MCICGGGVSEGVGGRDHTEIPWYSRRLLVCCLFWPGTPFAAWPLRQVRPCTLAQVVWRLQLHQHYGFTSTNGEYERGELGKGEAREGRGLYVL